MLNLERLVTDSYCSFHNVHHSKRMCLDWNRMMSRMATQLSKGNVVNEQVEPNVEDEEDFASNEALSTGHIVNVYQCSRATQNTTTKKEPLSC